MPSMESSTGKTKHAESCCSSLPAFMRVGELGMNFLVSIIRRNLSSDSSKRARASSLASLPLKRNSPSAMLRATRRNMSMGSSTGSPCSFFLR